MASNIPIMAKRKANINNVVNVPICPKVKNIRYYYIIDILFEREREIKEEMYLFLYNLPMPQTTIKSKMTINKYSIPTNFMT